MYSCTTCHIAKEVGDFYAQPSASRGHMTICKDCHKAKVRHRARINPAVQEYDRKRAKSPKRREHAARITRSWRDQNPVAYRAQTAVGNALRDGRLTKLPCEFCDRTDVHAHHKDYAKPLEVIWLCPKCHHRLHAMFPELEGKSKFEARESRGANASAERP